MVLYPSKALLIQSHPGLLWVEHLHGDPSQCVRANRLPCGCFVKCSLFIVLGRKTPILVCILSANWIAAVRSLVLHVHVHALGRLSDLLVFAFCFLLSIICSNVIDVCMCCCVPAVCMVFDGR